MKNLKFSFIIVLLAFLHGFVFAQLPDGMVGTSSFIDEIIKNYNDENAIDFDVNTINSSVNISLRVHVIKNKYRMYSLH